MRVEGGEGDLFDAEVIEYAAGKKTSGPEPDCCFGWRH
jgi:hypothetical protein